AFNQRVYLLERHIRRLRDSAAALGIAFPAYLDSADELVAQLCRANGLSAARIRITLTRGAFDGHLEHGRKSQSTCLVGATQLDKKFSDLDRRNTLSWTARLTLRHTTGQAAHKTLSYLPNVLAHSEAIEAGDDVALLRDGRGRPVEAATANLFAIRRGQIITPSIRQHCLPGIIRGRVIELARAAGLALRIAPLSTHELKAADEAFVTNAVVYVMPLRAVDGRALGEKIPGALTARLQRMMLDEVAAATAAR
ncbi:MAG: aminotransferase class IV, partial [Candidatus Alcyoniella australis]|nr:aminotransferase class IV [Candidatus Alcyoniella australis]